MCVISGMSEMNCELELTREIILHFEVVQQMLVHELNSYFALHTFDCARLHNLFDNRDDVGVLRSGKFLCVRKNSRPFCINFPFSIERVTLSFLCNSTTPSALAACFYFLLSYLAQSRN